MTTAASSVQANAVAKSWNRNVAQTIATATPLCQNVANLVAQYLPQINGWITEWTGERGREIVTHAVTQAEIPLTRDCVSLVTEYCQKSDVFGLEQLEKAAGGERELRKLLFGDPSFLSKFIFGEKTYNSEKPLPLDIDDEMQKDLGEIFSMDALGEIPGSIKVTELYSLYWSPAGMTASISEQIAKKHGQKFKACSHQFAFHEHGDSATMADRWIQFPNDVFGRNKTVQQQEILMPAGFEFPHFSDAVYCIFLKYACTGERIMADLPWTYTRCREKVREYILAVGAFEAVRNFHPHGLEFIGNTGDYDYYGVGYLRKFY